ncbi:MAG TPA: response regulator [Aggregatilinea sp.]|jgi:DNA-binding response OmpR family regulator|uniref:response regulator transcription factor n=1 Tax=Aggregatilinea sp. TaxID=2806333 RepID=UPI002CE13BE3|nr:response regulator [Aggregatilinea sp.]HML23202.1 response regulator [Aggregatilinea sp.]
MASILIVEDDLELQHLLGMVLERMGHAVQGSPDGLDALYRLREEKPDLVILDLMMPFASGDAVLGWIRSTKQLKDMRVLVVSAHPNGEIIASQLEADLFLQKPVDIHVFRDAVTSLLAV